MIHASALRKNKIYLQDYDYQGDIQNRLFLSHLLALEVELLEEILFNRLEIPLSKLQKNLSFLSQDELTKMLQKLLPLGLYTMDTSYVYVDKEKRKYYEAQLMKFDEDFKPDMDCLLHLLKKVPIHVLPTWYSIPKSSNNIFQSIIDKFLKTPQTYQRYCCEVGYHDPIFTGIMEDVFSSDDLEVYAAEIKEKYDLTEEAFHEYVLHLEFNFICTLSYTRTGDVWEEILTPFHEWREFLFHTEKSRPSPIVNQTLIDQLRPNPFAFIEDISLVLRTALQSEIMPTSTKICEILGLANAKDADGYAQQILQTSVDLQLVKLHSPLQVLDQAEEFLGMDLEHQAVYLYRHPSHKIAAQSPASLHERHQREVERSLKTVADSGWVYFEDFIRSSLIAMHDEQKVFLEKKSPKSWHYCLPQYSDEEKNWIHACIFSGLFHCAMVQIGRAHGKDCFRVSDFGQTFFG